MCNILLRRLAIWRNICKRILQVKDDFKFYLNVIDEYLNSEFINNNNKNYLRITRRNLLSAQKRLKK